MFSDRGPVDPDFKNTPAFAAPERCRVDSTVEALNRAGFAPGGCNMSAYQVSAENRFRRPSLTSGAGSRPSVVWT